MSLQSTAAAMIARYGESMVLKRATELDLPLKGKRLVGSIDAAGNSAVQQSFRVKICTTELAASAWAVKEPARGDFMVIGGKTRGVLNVSPLKDGDTVALYELELAG